MTDLVLIDGQNIGYAAQQCSPLSAGGQPTQAIFYSLRTLKVIREEFPNAELIWLWDDRAQWRYDIFPEYKSKRKTDPKMDKMREDFKLQEKDLKRMIHFLGIKQMRVVGYEADDMAGLLSTRAVARGREVALITSDKDWLQLVNGRCTWVDLINERRVNRAMFQEFTGCQSAEQFLECKALEGDKSDCIDGVPGVGSKAAQLIMEHYGSVGGLFANFDEHGEFDKDRLPGGLSRFKKKLNDFCDDSALRELFQRNLKLMNLRDVPRPTADAVKQVPGNYDLAKFKAGCERLSFQSIINMLHDWSVFEVK